MPRSQVAELFHKYGIPLTESESDILISPRSPISLEQTREVRLYFDRDKLSKVTVLFHIPRSEPTADNLIQAYGSERDRISQQFGPPAQDIAEMKAPTPTDRHAWLVRGRGYYRTLWRVDNMMEIVLWLFGEDAGIVFMETYESVTAR